MDKTQPDKFDDLYEHEAFLRRLVRSLGVADPTLVDDIIQDTYVKAWEARPSPEGNPRGWLATVARNFARMAQRSQRRRERREVAVARPDRAAAVDVLVGRRESRDRIRRALTLLPNGYRAAVELRFLDGLSFPDVGERLALSPEAARTRVRRGLEMLGDNLRPRRRRRGWFWWLPFFGEGAERRLCVPAWGLVALLLIGAGTVTCLLAAGGGESATARSVATESGAGVPAPRPPEAAARPLDLDPNRVDGPDIVVRGVISYDGAPFAGARVLGRVAHLEPFLEPGHPRYGYPFAYDLAELEAPYRVEPPLATVRTGSDGRFEFVTARRTRLTVIVDAPTFAPTRALVVVPFEGNPKEVRLELQRATPVQGTVTDEAGRPLSAAVTVLQGGAGRARTRWQTRTGPAGGFRVLARAPTMYDRTRVTITAEGYAAFHLDARPFTLDGVESVHDITLRRGCGLSGRVTTRAGAAVAGADVRVKLPVADGRWYEARATTDETGRYAIDNLPPVPVGFIAVTPPSNSGLASVRRALRRPIRLARKKAATHDVMLQRGAILRGTVRVGEARRAGAVVELINHRPLDTPFRTLPPVATTTTDDRGEFAFIGIPDGRFSFTARAPGFVRPVPAVLSGQARGAIDVIVAGGDPDPVQLDLVPAGAVEVHLGPEGTRTAGGSMTYVGLSARSSWQAQYVERTGIARFDHVAATEDAEVYVPGGGTARFAVRAGETVVVQLGRRPGTPRYRTRVVDGTGRPIRGARVALFALDEENVWKRVHRGLLERYFDLPFIRTTDRYGWCEHIADARGTLGVAAYAPGRAVATQTRSGSGDLTIRLERGARLRGIVRDAKPLAGAWVEIDLRSPGAYLPVARTGPDGRFEFTGPWHATYGVRARTRDRISEVTEARAGEEAVIVAAPAKPIRGVVFGDDGAALGGIGVGDGRAPPRITVTQPSGFFSLLLPEGNHDLQLRTHGSSYEVEVTRVRAATGGEDMRIRMRYVKSAHGVVLGPDGTPAIDGLVIARLKKPRPTGDFPMRTLDASGRFDFPGLGKHYADLLIVAEGCEPAVLALPHPGERTVRLRRGKSIDGTLLDESGRAAINVELSIVPFDTGVERRERRWTTRNGAAAKLVRRLLQRVVRTDEGGRFVFGMLAPGKYAIRLAEPGALRPAVRASGTSNLKLRMSPSRPLTVRLSGVDASVDLGTWRARIVTNGVLWGTASVQADRAFRFASVPTGEIFVSIKTDAAHSAQRVKVTGTVETVTVPVVKR